MIQGAGGLCKVRLKLPGRGKSSGAALKLLDLAARYPEIITGGAMPAGKPTLAKGTAAA